MLGFWLWFGLWLWLGLWLGSEKSVRVLIFPPEPSKECVKVSHVIFECRVINHHPYLFATACDIDKRCIPSSFDGRALHARITVYNVY